VTPIKKEKTREFSRRRKSRRLFIGCPNKKFPPQPGLTRGKRRREKSWKVAVNEALCIYLGREREGEGL